MGCKIIFRRTIFRIESLRAGAHGGLIGLCECPGKRKDASGQASRDAMEADIRSITLWHGQALVSVLEDEELKALGLQDVGVYASRAGVWWFRVPLKARDKPDDRFWRAWPHAAPALLEIVRNGKRIVIHGCGDFGRAKMVAGCLLTELGIGPDAALAAIRSMPPEGPLDAPAQELFLKQYLPRFSEHTRLRPS